MWLCFRVLIYYTNNVNVSVVVVMSMETIIR